VSRDFCFRLYHESTSPKPLKLTLGSLRNFSKIAEIFARVHHRWAVGWQIMGTISDCLHPKVNLKEKVYQYVNITSQSCPNKILKTFLIEDFSICHRCRVRPHFRFGSEIWNWSENFVSQKKPDFTWFTSMRNTKNLKRKQR
jgi:hypothetical protein